ncbi:bifunctional protein-disulfide isomerase/oxidoreductase DsbC [Vibrio profundum]|uniref:bifunctional protein-disulfide isomerase/oxidoreductase DsbC n=1 Tax=Vibrio profundum TaxID=2910247 RepID=UPI003D0E6497
MKRIRRLLLLTLPFVAATCFAAQAAPAHDESLIKQRVRSLGVKVLSIEPSGIKGLMEVSTSGGLLYASPDGEYFVAGTLYRLGKNGRYEDVAAKKQAPINAKKIAAFKDQMISFKAPNEKYAVTVFTDITCGYCVRLHDQIKEYNDLGITINYLAFPRQGPTSPVAEQMAAIWCATDPKDAMHEAKTSRRLPELKGDKAQQCKTNIAKQYALGAELGVKGTPAIFLPNGEMIGGYLPPKALLQKLQSK